MTRADWDALMLRWAHRSDIAADLGDVWRFATETFFNAWKNAEGRTVYATDDELLTAAPAPMQHAGMMYIHNLARDDEGMATETRMFNASLSDFVLNYSIRNVSPVMTRPRDAANAD